MTDSQKISHGRCFTNVLNVPWEVNENLLHWTQTINHFSILIMQATFHTTLKKTSNNDYCGNNLSVYTQVTKHWDFQLNYPFLKAWIGKNFFQATANEAWPLQWASVFRSQWTNCFACVMEQRERETQRERFHTYLSISQSLKQCTHKCIQMIKHIHAYFLLIIMMDHIYAKHY